MSAAAQWLAFAFGYLATYFLSTALPTRLWWYYPLQRRFRWQVRPEGLAMDFYGRIALCLAVGGVCLLLWRLLSPRLPASLRSRAERGLLVWVVGFFLFAGGLYLFLLWHRDPVPVPLPPGYVPR